MQNLNSKIHALNVRNVLMHNTTGPAYDRITNLHESRSKGWIKPPSSRTTQTYYQFGNLFVNKTVIEFKTGEPWKQVEVTRFDGQYHEILAPNDPDYKKAHILSINLDNA